MVLALVQCCDEIEICSETLMQSLAGLRVSLAVLPILSIACKS